MESSGHNAQVDMAIHMPSAAFDPFSRDLNGFTNDDTLDASTLGAMPAVDATPSFMQLPIQQTMPESNLRAGDELVDAAQQAPAQVDAANMVAQIPHIKDENLDTFANYMVAADTDPVSAVSEMSLNLEEMKGYAQLVFPDGEYLVTSTEIMLGRDERAQQILKEQEKRQKKLWKEQAALQARQQAAEINARAALESYKLEDVSGSAEARRGSSASSQLLEGRPAPGLPSTFSESGGIVNYEGSVNDPRRKRHRRHLLLSRSSSTNSVAPASLHVYGAAAAPWGSNDDEKCIFLPIHPFQIEDIRKISKEHLRIFYDSVEKHWKMEIKGNGAFVLNELYKETASDPETGAEEIAPRHFKRGDTVILTHNTEVLVTSLTFLFKLPQRRGFSTFDSDDEGNLDTSPTQGRTETGEDDQDSDLSDVDENIAKQDTPKRPKILLKASKPKVVEEDSPEPPRPTGGKGKKKPSDAVPAPVQEPVASTDQGNPQPAAPPVFDANSTLQHVPVNELPEKRKGPGRPPKNGLVSKRDEGIIRRKMKEYEKRGERPPPYKDILAIVRAENRAKELAARAVARGEPMPPTQVEMMNAMPTTELGQPLEPTMSNTIIQSTELVDPVRQGSQEPEVKTEMLGSVQSQPQQQRTYKSPSPMKPREEYTEEQLKRPTQTYYYILDEILTEGPEDAMELQQIYDKICKKYPFYKYVVESTGWQSSVRHNLKQNERFKPVSKQGKGWLWAIDPAVPLDKEKKKKPTPPPMPRPAMPYQTSTGSMQYGASHAGYSGQYGTQYVNGQAQYNTPGQQNTTTYNSTYTAPAYGQPGATGQPTPQAATNGAQPTVQPQQPAVPRNLSHPPSRPASRTPQPAGPPGALPPAFQDLVEEIMRFRVEYLSPFGKDPALYARHERIFKRCVEWISQLHMRQNPEVKFENEEEKRVFQILEQMRHKFEHGGGPPKPAQAVPQPALAQPGQTQTSAVPQQVQPPQAGGAPQQVQQSQPGVLAQQNQPQIQPQSVQQVDATNVQPPVTATQAAGPAAVHSLATENAALVSGAHAVQPTTQSAVPAFPVPQQLNNPIASDAPPPSTAPGPLSQPSTAVLPQTTAAVSASLVQAEQLPQTAQSQPIAIPAEMQPPQIAQATPSEPAVVEPNPTAPPAQVGEAQQVAGVKRAASVEAGEHNEKRAKLEGEQ